MEDVAVIGGGIVGLACAAALVERRPGCRVVVLDKEPAIATHQTGRNSGVVHSGIYYRPGSLKARLCLEGNARLAAFCAEHGIAHAVTGKLIVATDEAEVGRLDVLAERAAAHGIAVDRLGPAGMRDHEPHVAGVAGLWVRSTGICDFPAVAAACAKQVVAAGGVIRTGTTVTGVRDALGHYVLDTDGDPVQARSVVNCAGLHADRVARRSGVDPPARIVPFRGEYFELTPPRRSLVRGLIYPVPDPSFPFLGVHFTRMVDGSVHAGPNAVLAFAREGYRRRDVARADLVDTLGYRGFWALARRHWRTGSMEMARSASKRLFLRSLRRLVPDVGLDDLIPAAAGVRAQALTVTGALVDDFLIVGRDRMVHVLNAPSPAATSSLAIGHHVAGLVEW